MLEERPELIGLINTSNGFTPLATAVRKGIDRASPATHADIPHTRISEQQTIIHPNCFVLFRHTVLIEHICNILRLIGRSIALQPIHFKDVFGSERKQKSSKSS